MPGLLALARAYGEPRLEAALDRWLGSPTRKSVKAILQNGRDLLRTTTELALEFPAHNNVRVPGYWRRRR